MVTKYTAKGNPYKEPPYTEQERLRNINAALFKRGLPQVTSILEWEQRVNSPSNAEPPSTKITIRSRPVVKVYTKDGSAFHEPPYTEQEHLDLQRWMNGGVVRFSSLQHPRQPKKTRESEA